MYVHTYDKNACKFIFSKREQIFLHNIICAICKYYTYV